MNNSKNPARTARRTLPRLTLLLASASVLPFACSQAAPVERVGVATEALVAAPSLGTAQAFSVLGGSTVTNTGATTLNGDLGVSPGQAITGFPPGLVIGATHAGDAVATQAQSDVTTAYNVLAGDACGSNLTGQDLGGLTLTTGVYCFSSSAQLTGTLTLDAQGDPDAVFIFQVGSTLTTASDASVVLLNGAQKCNVFWQVGSSATIGTGTDFTGNILALTSITLTTGASVAGRALARNGAVTMDQNQITASVCDAGSGSCVGQPDGASCADGNACTQSDTCQAGACVGATPVVCTLSGNCTVVGVCAPATGVCSPCSEGSGSSNGEPHLTTFDQLLYDFQGTGDFVLVNAGASMMVQARQVLTNAFPAGPNTAMNAAAAAKLGTDRVAVFARPLKILVNGVPSVLSSTPRLLPGGALVAQEGTLITLSRAGSSVRFSLGSILVNVLVRLDPSVTGVTGMLGNRDGNPSNDLITRTGQALALPISFSDLYTVFGASWVVRPGESLFGSAALLAPSAPNPYVIPSAAITSAQFPDATRSFAEIVCTDAAIADLDLFEACMLDVAATEDPTSAEVFAGMAPPKQVVRFGDSAPRPGAPASEDAPSADPANGPTGCSMSPVREPGSPAWWLLAAALGVAQLRRRNANDVK